MHACAFVEASLLLDQNKFGECACVCVRWWLSSNANRMYPAVRTIEYGGGDGAKRSTASGGGGPSGPRVGDGVRQFTVVVCRCTALRDERRTGFIITILFEKK